MYYLYLSPIKEWTKPPKGTTRAQLLACYRHVRQMSDATQQPIAAWDDGRRVTPTPHARKRI